MTPPPRQLEGGWPEFRNLILESLERLHGDLRAVRDKDLCDIRASVDAVKDDMRDRFEALRQEDLESMKLDILMLKVKASVWGALAGLIGGAIISAVVAKFIH